MLIECPTCDARVDGKDFGSMAIETGEYPHPVKAVLLQCPTCKGPMLGFSEIEQLAENEFGFVSADRKWPPPDRDLGSEIPSIAGVSLQEAQRCFNGKAYTACAVMCGRALEGVCVHHYPDKKRLTLDAGLKQLKDDGIIDQRIYAWGDALRQKRNLGAHASSAVISKADARDLLDFCLAICDYVFVLNEKFMRFQQREDKSNRLAAARSGMRAMMQAFKREASGPIPAAATEAAKPTTPSQEEPPG